MASFLLLLLLLLSPALVLAGQRYPPIGIVGVHDGVMNVACGDVSQYEHLHRFNWTTQNGFSPEFGEVWRDQGSEQNGMFALVRRLRFYDTRCNRWYRCEMPPYVQSYLYCIERKSWITGLKLELNGTREVRLVVHPGNWMHLQCRKNGLVYFDQHFLGNDSFSTWNDGATNALDVRVYVGYYNRAFFQFELTVPDNLTIECHFLLHPPTDPKPEPLSSHRPRGPRPTTTAPTATTHAPTATTTNASLASTADASLAQPSVPAVESTTTPTPTTTPTTTAGRARKVPPPPQVPRPTTLDDYLDAVDALLAADEEAYNQVLILSLVVSVSLALLSVLLFLTKEALAGCFCVLSPSQ